MASDRLNAAVRVKAWTRARFSLANEVAVFASEVQSSVPGFPPVHTVVAFSSAHGQLYHFKLFKPLEAVVEEDLPPAWYREALAVPPGGMGCSCC